MRTDCCKNFNEFCEGAVKLKLPAEWDIDSRSTVANIFKTSDTHKFRFGILELRNRATKSSYENDVTLRVTSSKNFI